MLTSLKITPSRAAVCLGIALTVTSTPFAGAEETTIKDSRGVEITLALPVDSVAIFPLPIPEVMIAVDGGASRLTAINPRAQAALMNGVIGELFPEIANISTDLVAGNFVPNVEAILAAGPDVVLQWEGDDRVNPMVNAGIKVATVSTASAETRRGYISMLGDILGQQERAQAFLDWETKTVADLAAAIEAAGLEQPRIAFIDSMNDNEFVVFGQQQVYFSAAGMINAATEAGHTEGSVKVGAEALLEWKPDIVFVNYYNAVIKPSDILKHPVLAGLDAVKNGRVYKTPAIDPATAAGGELAYMWFAEIAYPEVFTTDVRAEELKGFEFLYGKTLNDDQIDRLLQMSWNGGSAGYTEAFGK